MSTQAVTYPTPAEYLALERAAEIRHEYYNGLIVAQIEILSPGTEKIDRGRKARAYRTIPSLHEYLLIAQDRPLIERYTRQSGTHLWLLEDIQGMEAALTLESIGFTMGLADIYAQVTFEPEPEPGAPPAAL